MTSKVMVGVANSVIAVVAVAGGLVLTNHYSGGSAPSISATTTAAVSGTATSDAIPYQFGQVQLSVTEVKGKITAIDPGTSSATAGREAAFSYLVQDAITAQGTNFGNVSGATYTTDAFKQALSSALSKLG